MLGMLVNQHRTSWFASFSPVSGGSLLMVLWSFCGLVIALSYTTTLLASLVAVPVEPAIDTFESLLDQLDKYGGEIWNVKVWRRN